jgi:hypothetical protein
MDDRHRVLVLDDGETPEALAQQVALGKLLGLAVAPLVVAAPEPEDAEPSHREAVRRG